MKNLWPTMRAAFVPIAVCGPALGGLASWTASGAAGRPAKIDVTSARILLPYGGETTAAVFQLRNTGGADDALVQVRSAATGPVMLSRSVDSGGAGEMQAVASVAVPAHGTVQMSPFGLDAMVQRPPRLKVGDSVPFELVFRDGRPVRVDAVVVAAADAMR